MSSEQGITMNKQFGLVRHTFVSLLAVVMLSGCGGGNDAQSVNNDTTGTPPTDPTDPTEPDTPDPDPIDPNTPNRAPVANAGLDQKALAGSTIYLPGSGEDVDGTIASYEWVQASGTTAVINNNTAATTTVVLPSVSQAERLAFSLTVTDNRGASHTDNVTITLFVEDEPVNNAKPRSDAGADQVVAAGEEVMLSGVGEDLDGLIMSYAWTQSNGPAVTLSGANTSEPSFTAPQVDDSRTLTFVLTVTDDDDATAVDDVNVEVFPLMTPPQNVQAEAEPDVIILTWDEVPGAASYDIYHARESFGSTPDLENYKTLLDGTLVTGQTSNRYELDTPPVAQNYYFVITAIRDKDESDPSAEVSVESKVGYVVKNTGLLNDTGFDLYSDTSSISPLEFSSFEGQDAYFGRDQDSNLIKSGAGRAGFDFTKVDDSGRSLSASDTEWSCVFDHRTGLLWEVKAEAESDNVQAADSTFTWYFTAKNISGERPGTAGGGRCNLDSRCDTQAYIEEMNQQKLCGRNDWRLPTVTELKSIVDHGSEDVPLIDENYFPNAELGAYWSMTVASNTSVNQKEPGNPMDNAWLVEFYDGVMEKRSRNSRLRVRVVSGGSDDE